VDLQLLFQTVKSECSKSQIGQSNIDLSRLPLDPQEKVVDEKYYAEHNDLIGSKLLWVCEPSSAQQYEQHHDEGVHGITGRSHVKTGY